MTHRLVESKNRQIASLRHLTPHVVPQFASIATRASSSRLSSDDFLPSKPARKRSRRKRVRFQVDQEGDLGVDAIVPTCGDIPEYTSICFYNHEERIRMKREALVAASELTISHFNLVLSMEGALGSPVGLFRSARIEACSEDAARLLPELLVERGARGLELLLSQTLRQHQKWAIKSTLDLQATLRRVRSPTTSLELHTWSEHVNKATREFALILARVDEVEALKIHSAL